MPLPAGNYGRSVKKRRTLEVVGISFGRRVVRARALFRHRPPSNTNTIRVTTHLMIFFYRKSTSCLPVIHAHVADTNRSATIGLYCNLLPLRLYYFFSMHSATNRVFAHSTSKSHAKNTPNIACHILDDCFCLTQIVLKGLIFKCQINNGQTYYTIILCYYLVFILYLHG